MSQPIPGKRSHKETNQIRVFLALKESSPLSKNELCRRLDLSRPTVDGAITRLLTSNLAVRSGHGPSQGGRRAILYAFNSRANYAIGGDLEIPELNLALCGLDGTPGVEKGVLVPRELLSSPKETLDFVIRSVRQLTAEAGIPLKRVAGLGLGLPVSLDGGTISFPGETLPRWTRVPARRVLEEGLGIPVFIDNDVNYMALAESRAQPEPAAVLNYVALRKGQCNRLRMGASSLLDGQIFHGGNGNAVALDHAVAPLPVFPAGQGGRRPTKVLMGLVSELISPILQMIQMFDPNKLVVNAIALGQAEAAFVNQVRAAVKSAVNLTSVSRLAVEPARDRQYSGAKGGALAVLYDLFSRPSGLIEGLAQLG
jgi:hypothetical protein